MLGNWNSGCSSALAGMARSFHGTSWMLKRCKQARWSCWRSLAHGGVLAFEEWPPLCECVFRSQQLGEIASLCQGTVSTFSLLPLHPLCIPLCIPLCLSLPDCLSFFIIFFYIILFISYIQFSTFSGMYLFCYRFAKVFLEWHVFRIQGCIKNPMFSYKKIDFVKRVDENQFKEMEVAWEQTQTRVMKKAVCVWVGVGILDFILWCL